MLLRGVPTARIHKIVNAIPLHVDLPYHRILLEAIYLLTFFAFLWVGEMALNNVAANGLQFEEIQFFQIKQSQLVQLELTFHFFKHNHNI